MAEWTPEATEYLDGYLKQLRALARGAGEDGEEIASGLREHIIEKTERESGPLVTLDVLRRALAEVGTPEVIVGDPASWKTQGKSDGKENAPTYSRPPTAPPAVPPVAPPARDHSGRFLRWTLGCLVLLVVGPFAVSILGVLAGIGLPAMSRAREAARRAECQNHLKQIGMAIKAWEKDHPNATKYPAKFSELFPKYIDDARVFQCPVSQLVASNPIDDWCAYEFNDDSNDNSIVREKKVNSHYPAGRNVLYSDGRVIFERDPDYEKSETVGGAGRSGGEPFRPEVEPTDDVEAHSANKKDAILAVQAIAQSEQEFLRRARLDSDGDGKPDYGDLKALDGETGDISTFGRHEIEGYALHIELTSSSQPGGPSFVCMAIPLHESASAQTIAIGPDGVLRLLTKDEMKREQATQRL